jgi:5-methylthioadenosine/S-adenosylhomocysteine deaminase
MKILLKNALVLTNGKKYSFLRQDILINQNLIAEVSDDISCNADEIIDCTNRIVMPGLINAHTHAPMSLLRGQGDDLQLKDWLNKFTWPREAKMSSEQIKIGAMLAIAEMIRCGVTCFDEHYFHMDAIAKAVEQSGIRAVLGYSMIDRTKFVEKPEFDFEGKGKKELKISEKFIKDWNNKAEQRITVSVSPHASFTCSEQLLNAASKSSKKHDCILHIHAAETRSELAFMLNYYKLRPIQFLKKCGCINEKSVLAHGVYVSKSEIEIIARNKASVCTCPVSNLKLASGGAPPIPQYLKSKVNLCIGTDGAASNNTLSIFESMKIGALEQKNFHFDASIIRADDYLYMGTKGGAKALNINAGEIQKNKLADLIMLDINSPNIIPFVNNAGWLVYAAGPQNVTDTMVNGKWLMRDRIICTFDEYEILKKAQKTADSLN